MLKTFKLNFKLGKPTLNGRIYDPVQFREKVLRMRGSVVENYLFSEASRKGEIPKIKNIKGVIKKIKYTSDGCEISVKPLKVFEPFFNTLPDKVYFTINVIGELDRNKNVNIYGILYFFITYESV